MARMADDKVKCLPLRGDAKSYGLKDQPPARGAAVLSTSGAQALQTCGADVIAGLAGAIHEAKRVRDMREYPFWARG